MCLASNSYVRLSMLIFFKTSLFYPSSVLDATDANLLCPTKTLSNQIISVTSNSKLNALSDELVSIVYGDFMVSLDKVKFFIYKQ